MPGTFQERTRLLLERVGGGTLVGSVIVDQVYAKYQHERRDLKHPRGGKSHYLWDPMRTRAPRILQRTATNLFRGYRPRTVFRIGMDDVASDVVDQAPREMGDLRHSANPRVIDGGTMVYNRPPARPRLNKAALRAKYKVRPSNFDRRR